MRLNYKRGLLRLWIATAVLWLVAVAVVNSERIGFYAGYHYALFQGADSWSAALVEKHRVATLSQLCKRASETACPLLRDKAAYTQCMRTLPPPRNEFDCMLAHCDREKYLQHAKALFASAGFPTDKLTAQGCDDFKSIVVPYLNWTRIGAAVLPILLPLILWGIGSWISRGFAKARTEKE